MLIINGGVPRSGTVLVGNLIRLMLERRGISWMRYNPQERRHLPEFLRVVKAGVLRKALIVHTHLIDEPILQALEAREDAVLLWNHRDPRDALVSLMKLHDLQISHAVMAMKVYFEAAELATASESCLELRYSDLTNDLTGQIERVADKLAVQSEPDEMTDLVAATSLEAHGKIVSDLNANNIPDAVSHQTRHRDMREDPRTLLNDRHIQSGRTGRWRDELTLSEQQQVQSELDKWIERFGYEQ